MTRDDFQHTAIVQIFVGFHCVDRKRMKVEDEAEESVRLAKILTDFVFPPRRAKVA